MIEFSKIIIGSKQMAHYMTVLHCTNVAYSSQAARLERWGKKTLTISNFLLSLCLYLFCYLKKLVPRNGIL